LSLIGIFILIFAFLSSITGGAGGTSAGICYVLGSLKSMPPPTSKFSFEEPISPDACFANYFLKIYPLVIGLRLLDELVSCLS
jgi:hypothetical protein